VTLIARVDPPEAGGTVSFVDGLTALGTAPLSGGEASLAISTLATGAHTITAVYSGDASHSGNTSPAFAQTVEKEATAITISAAPNPAMANQPITLTATVEVAPPASTTPAGTVTFYAGDNVLGTGALDAAGKATFSAPAMTSGKYDFKAIYGGSAALSQSTSSVVTLVIP
jgi:hypothetical protein